MGGGCCIGDCCVANCGFFQAIRDFFCSDSCCVGNAPGPSASEVHAKTVANELAEMKEKMDASARKQESSIMDYINRTLNSFLREVKALNQEEYGGKRLNINVDLILKKNDELKSHVVGCIGNVVNKRLVQTDKELSLILEERDEKKRQKNFQAFVDKIKNQAIKEFTKEVESAVGQQSELVRGEINARLEEVNRSMEESIRGYTAILESKKRDGQELERIQAKYRYQSGLCDLLLSEIGDN